MNYFSLFFYKLEAKRLAVTGAAVRSFDGLFWLQRYSPVFRSDQKKAEITRLLADVKRLAPERVLEIGTARGGTLFLFSQAAKAGAQLISVDYQYPSPMYPLALPGLARRGQKITSLVGDSHGAGMLQRVEGFLGGRPLDFLFIDGDHSYEGVKQDYEMYAPLVRRGGLIAFHDILADYRQRYGRETSNYTGGVPAFWQELAGEGCERRAYIADAEQDGYGIGVMVKG